MVSASLLIAGSFLSWIPASLALSAVAAMGLAAVLRDVGALDLRLPQNARQVPQSVFDAGLSTAAIRFGFELGTGLRTYLTAATPYLLAVGVLLLSHQPWWSALLAGVGFGLGRVVMPLARSFSDDSSWDDRLSRSLRWATPVGTALCTAAVLLAAA